MRTHATSIIGYALEQRLRVLNSSFLLLYFFNLLLSLSLSFSQSFSSCPPFFESFFVLYTMVFTPFPPSTYGSGVGSSFSLFSLASP